MESANRVGGALTRLIQSKVGPACPPKAGLSAEGGPVRRRRACRELIIMAGRPMQTKEGMNKYKYSDITEKIIGASFEVHSFLGIMGHYKTYKMRKRVLFENLSVWWWNYTYLSNGYQKFNLR